MISAAKTNESARGFTLIELVMVLAISAIVMGGAVGLMVFSSGERTLRKASGEIELLAKRARTIAILNQIPYALEFREGNVRLLPFAQAGSEQKRSSDFSGESEEAASDSSRELALPSGVELAIRHWNSTEWRNVSKKTTDIWRFDPDGLCEPLTIRLSLEKSWSEDTYHPLTATISESALEIQ